VGVLYGRPISPDEIEKMGDREFARQLTTEMRRLQNQIRILLRKRPYDYSTQVSGVESAEMNMQTPLGQ
jgi:hypothetical protein